jgi:Protein of unknown function (DUF3154).
MWGVLAKFIPFLDPITSIVGKLADAKVELAKAETDEKRIAAKERVDTLQMRRDVLVAEAGSGINAKMRAGLALGPMVYLTKIFLFDKVLGSFLGYTKDIFTTDPLDDNLWKVVVAVVGFYFLYEIGARFKR